jgi:hypothetical protein
MTLTQYQDIERPRTNKNLSRGEECLTLRQIFSVINYNNINITLRNCISTIRGVKVKRLQARVRVLLSQGKVSPASQVTSSTIR